MGSLLALLFSPTQNTVMTQFSRKYPHTYIYACIPPPLDAKQILVSEAQTQPSTLVSIRQLTTSAVRLRRTSWPAVWPWPLLHIFAAIFASCDALF